MSLDLKSMTRPELSDWVQSRGFPRYRADQLYGHLCRGVASLSDFPNLPRPLLEEIERENGLSPFEIVNKRRSLLDETAKYLVKLENQDTVECVVMSYDHGLSACLSTQAGCRMGCAFCATGKGGFSRNLTAGEIRDEFLFLQRDQGRRIDSFVLMGMGEPLDNYDAVVRFLELMRDPDGVGLSPRHAVISTCGLPDRIRSLARDGGGVTLAVSLHAPNDSLRRELLPIARAVSLSELLDSCRFYEQSTGRRVTFEYTMIHGFNDTPACARELCGRLAGMRNRHVNLIPVNPVEGSPFRPSTKAEIFAFPKLLQKGGVTATVRRSLGSDISGSCGQLRAKQI